MKGNVNIQGNMPRVEFLLKFIVSYRSSHLIMSDNMNLVLNVNPFCFPFQSWVTGFRYPALFLYSIGYCCGKFISLAMFMPSLEC